jgi:hypothetical protein
MGELQAVMQPAYNQCKQVAPSSRWTQLTLRPCCRRYTKGSVSDQYARLLVLVVLLLVVPYYLYIYEVQVQPGKIVVANIIHKTVANYAGNVLPIIVRVQVENGDIVDVSVPNHLYVQAGDIIYLQQKKLLVGGRKYVFLEDWQK